MKTNKIKPTKETILSTEVKFKMSTLRIVKEWKKNFYDKKWSSTNRNDAIKALIEMLAENYNTTVEIHMAPDAVDSYNRLTRTIHLNSANPSIVTALHEFAHHIKGPDENHACRWSVWIFIKVFPLAYSKLVWDKHMLVKERL